MSKMRVGPTHSTLQFCTTHHFTFRLLSVGPRPGSDVEIDEEAGVGVSKVTFKRESSQDTTSQDIRETRPKRLLLQRHFLSMWYTVNVVHTCTTHASPGGRPRASGANRDPAPPAATSLLYPTSQALPVESSHSEAWTQRAALGISRVGISRVDIPRGVMLIASSC
jgi:hypothetical protein